VQLSLVIDENRARAGRSDVDAEVEGHVGSFVALRFCWARKYTQGNAARRAKAGALSRLKQRVTEDTENS